MWYNYITFTGECKSQGEHYMPESYDGHRNRLRSRFLATGFNGFAPHEVLEMLLFYAIPRRDTRPIARELLSHFGSFDRVLEASHQELSEVKGIGDSSATYLKMIFESFRFYNSQKRGEKKVISSVSEAMSFAESLFFGETEEVAYLICLDAKQRLINTVLVCRGNVNAAAVSLRGVIEGAARSRAVSCILTHNHPGGAAAPSFEDIETTKRIMLSLGEMGITLLDHIIVAEEGVRSLEQGGIMSRLREKEDKNRRV